MLPGRRVVGPDLRADPILERGDDFAARRVVLGICGKDHQEVERQANGVAFDLDVAFLKNVEQSHLDLACEVGQLVDAEDPAIGTRKQPVVNRELVGQLQSAARRLDGIDVAHHIGDRHVRRRQLLHVSRLPRPPGDRCGVAVDDDARTAGGANRFERIVVNLASRDDRQVLVEQRRQRAQDAALRLTAEAEQNEIVPRQDGVDELRDHGLVVTDDAGKQRLAAPQLSDQVVANFVLHRPARKRIRRRGPSAA